MPARTSARSGRLSTATVSHKASSTTLNSRASAVSSRVSSMHNIHMDHIPAEPESNALRSQIAPIFRDAQKNTASHRKLAVNLRKIQEACCYEPTSVSASNAASDEFSEDDFNTEFYRCVLRVLPVKKSEPVGDKVVRFIGLFLRHAIEKDNELLGEVDEDASTMPETPGTRLTAFLVEQLLSGRLVTKDKYVRYRATQLISHVVNSLDAIDDDLFQKLRAGLLRRVRDKEAMVRAQAVLGLGRLAGNSFEEEQNDDSDSDGGGGAAASGLLDRLLEVLQNDPSADVRRSLLVNLPILPKTLPYLLERARDSDAATRRAVYARLLPALGDFRHLSLSMREKLLRWGLRDRDENVRKAAGRLFRERWIEDCAALPPGEDGEVPEAQGPSIDGLLELLERIDVVNSGVEDGVALEAMQGFWEGRPDYRDAVAFDDMFWETLSAESVFIARSFNDFCRSDDSGKYEYLVEEKLPEVTKLAFYLERYLKVLVDAIRQADERAEAAGEEEEDEEEDTVEQEFIVEQLLHIALTLDYSDEVGRRKMFALLRQSLSIAELPDEVTKLTVDVLRDICAPDAAGEREFCSVVLEAVADVHDTILDDVDTNEGGGAASAGGGGHGPSTEDDSFHSARSEVSNDTTPTRGGSAARSVGGGGSAAAAELTEEEAQAKAIKEIVINMKCLHIVQCMLSNVAGSLQKNDHLVAMLNNLVVPAVRSHEAPVRERGLVCLGLCALLDRSLAEENLDVFVRFYTKGHTSLQITALHILTDILNVHGAQLLSSNAALLRVYVKALRSPSSSRAAVAPEVQATATVAVSKLLLGRVVTEPEVARELLRTLVVAYFEPASARNQGVRQALNYFLPVFCYSRPANQALLADVALDALHTLFNVREGLEDDADADVDVAAEMVSLATVGACLVDWTDPRKCFVPGMAASSSAAAADAAERKNVNGDVHLSLAQGILERLGRGSMSKEEKKVLAPLLGKLYVSPASSEEALRALYAEVGDAVEGQMLADATSRNALYKIHVSLGKIVNNLDQAAAAATTGRASLSRGRRSTSRATSLGVDDRTVLGSSTVAEQTVLAAVGKEPGIKEEAEEDDDDVDGTEDVTVDGVDADELDTDLDMDEAVVDATTAVRVGSGGVGDESLDDLVDDLIG